MVTSILMVNKIREEQNNELITKLSANRTKIVILKNDFYAVLSDIPQNLEKQSLYVKTIP